MTILDILPWALPPVIGAIIGWVTNKIAITMLFRPYEEKRIFGLKVPFTPGIIPKQRHELAQGVARTVSRELINEETVRKHAGNTMFLESMKRTVAGITDRILAAHIRFEGSGAVPLLQDLGVALFQSEGITRLLRFGVDGAVNLMEKIKIRELAPASDRIPEIQTRLLEVVQGEEFREKTRASLANWLEHHSDDRLARIITKNVENQIMSAIEAAYPTLVGVLIDWLKNPSTKRILGEQGRRLLKDILRRLNLLQRLFISAGQYDRTIDDRMDDIILDTIHSLEETVRLRREHFLGSIRKAIGGVRRMRVRDVLALADLPPHAFPERIAEWVENGSRFLIRDMLPAVYRLWVSSDMDVIEVLTRFLGRDRSELSEEIEGHIRDAFFQTGEGGLLQRLFPNGLEPGKLFNLEGGLKERVDDAIAAQALDLIVARVPQILEAVDIQRLVEERVNSFDVERMERIILDVVEKQLKYINLFGALLGAIIGLSQSLYLFLG